MWGVHRYSCVLFRGFLVLVRVRSLNLCLCNTWFTTIAPPSDSRRYRYLKEYMDYYR